MKLFVVRFLLVGLAWLLAVAPVAAAPSFQTGSSDCDSLNQAGMSLYRQARYADALEQFQQANACYREIGDRAREGTTLNNIGAIYYRLGQYEQALDTYRQSLGISREIGDRAGEGTTLNNIGLIYDHLGQYEQALDTYQQSLTIAQEIGDRAKEGSTLNNIGLIYDHLGQYEQALDTYQQSLGISREIGDWAGEGTTLNNIGLIYDSLGQYEQALGYYQQSLTILKEIGDRAGEGTTLNNIGGIYDSLGQYEQALDYYQQGLSISQEIGDRTGEGTALNKIGAIYRHLGQYEQALDTYQQSLTIAQEIGDQAAQGQSLHNIGFIYSRLGQYEQALDTYQQSLTILKEIGDRDGENATLNNIGLVYARLGQYEQALYYYQQGLIISREIGDRSGEGTALNNIGGIYDSLGQYEQALYYYQQGLTILKEIGDRAVEGTTLNNIGFIYSRLGQYEQALEYYQQSLSIAQEIGDRAGEGTTLNNIGGIYDRLGQYEQALDYFQQGLTIRKEIGDRAGEGQSLNNIGLVYARLGQYEPALDTYQQSLGISQEIGDRAMEGTTLNNIGVIYHSLGQYDQALNTYRQSLVISQEIGDRAVEGTILNNIGGIYHSLDQYEQALDYYQGAMETFETVRAQAGTEEGRAKFIAQYASLYRRSAGLFHRQHQDAEAFYTTERGRARAFLDSLATAQVRLRDDDAADLLAQEGERYAQRQALRFDLAEARAADPPDPALVADLEARLAEAEAAYQKVQEAIAARGAELAALVPGRGQDYLLSVSQVQGLLDEGTTVVSYFVLEDEVLVFLITSDRFETVLLEVSPEELRAQITAFRDFADVTEPYPGSAVTLYGWLIEPLKEHFTTPHLAIVPHDVLHYLPFAALTDGERYLLDDYTLTVLPSASTLPFIQENAELTAFSGQPSALILGNPVTADYDTVASLATTRDSLGSLPFAEKEAKAIAELFDVEPLIGEAATESAVREKVSEATILHLAAHGKFNPVAPLNSLIALAPDDDNDGWLTVGESYGLDLEQTDLVVLSACQTNLGELSAGDELVGLTRAFIFAGTPTVVASLWSVEDEATALLMERFYTHLRDGMGKAEALRQAQLEVREQHPNPYYWAGFVLSGDGGEVGDVIAEATPVSEKEKETKGGICLGLMLPSALAVAAFWQRRSIQT